LNEGDFVGDIWAAFELPQSVIVIGARENQLRLHKIDVGIEVRHSAEMNFRQGTQKRKHVDTLTTNFHDVRIVMCKHLIKRARSATINNQQTRTRRPAPNALGASKILIRPLQKLQESLHR